MPLNTPPRSTKKQPFLYGMIVAEFAAARTPLGDFQAEDTAALVARVLNRPAEDGFSTIVAELIVYTQDCTFHWEAGAPAEWREFETFWKMIAAGDVETAVAHFAARVDNIVFTGAGKKALGWYDAFKIASRPYTPPAEWRPLAELSEAEQADPLS